MENLKIEKGKTYTYEELKEKSEDPQLVISTMLSGMVILHTMEDNLFVKEEKENV